MADSKGKPKGEPNPLLGSLFEILPSWFTSLAPIRVQESHGEVVQTTNGSVFFEGTAGYTRQPTLCWGVPYVQTTANEASISLHSGPQFGFGVPQFRPTADRRNPLAPPKQPWFLRIPCKYQQAMVSTMLSKWCEMDFAKMHSIRELITVRFSKPGNLP